MSPHHGRRHVAMRATALVLAMASAILSAGCAAHAPPRPAPGYDHMVDSLGSADASGLTGRRIVLDPGHGGFFRGALGLHGLTEAEVNLRVALDLRDLLVAHGAVVRLTRDTDRDFLAGPDSALRVDLAERVRLANDFAPDLFLSIHHNADAGGRHDVNETQTYYKLGDEGPSLDVAQDVHRALVRNVGIATHKVVSGNYFVLRNSTAPAILTETSYLTDPDVEARLRLPEKQQIEAQALYLGLARYFARPVPTIGEFAAWDPDSDRADTAFAHDVEVRASVDGEFDVAELRVDDAPVPLTRTGRRLAWRPRAPLPQGEHQARLWVRRTVTGAARERVVRFAVRRPVARLALESWPARTPAREGRIGLRVTALDGAGLADPDSGWVRIVVRRTTSTRAATSPAARGGPVGTRADPAHAPRQRSTGRTGKTGGKSRAAGSVAPPPLFDQTLATRDGVAWAYVPVPGATALDVTAEWVARDSTGPPVSRTALMLTPGSDAWTGFVPLMPGDTALTGAPGTREPAPELEWINRDGFAVLDRDAAGVPDIPQLPGFRRWAAPRPDGGAAFTAIAGEALAGRRIVLDPDGGGDQSGGAGRSGTRAANLNLEVARSLAGLLAAAGAAVKLTREGDVALADLERVQISEAFRAERFVRIGHRAEPPRIGYYFASSAGRRCAEHLAAECARMGIPVPPIAEDAQYPLQQTSCPALYASLARIDDPAAEDRLLAPGAARAEAWALMLALAREWGSDSGWAADSVTVRDAAGRPLAGAAVRLGGALLAETDARGVARFVRTEPGPTEIAIEHPRAHLVRVLLDSDHGVVLTGPR